MGLIEHFKVSKTLTNTDLDTNMEQQFDIPAARHATTVLERIRGFLNFDDAYDPTPQNIRVMAMLARPGANFASFSIDSDYEPLRPIWFDTMGLIVDDAATAAAQMLTAPKIAIDDEWGDLSERLQKIKGVRIRTQGPASDIPPQWSFMMAASQNNVSVVGHVVIEGHYEWDDGIKSSPKQQSYLVPWLNGT